MDRATLELRVSAAGISRPRNHAPVVPSGVMTAPSHRQGSSVSAGSAVCLGCGKTIAFPYPTTRRCSRESLVICRGWPVPVGKSSTATGSIVQATTHLRRATGREPPLRRIAGERPCPHEDGIFEPTPSPLSKKPDSCHLEKHRRSTTIKPREISLVRFSRLRAEHAE